MPTKPDRKPRLKAYALCVIRFISTQTMDPHLYFEKKYSGELDSAESDAAALELIDSLLSWISGADFGPDQLALLDRNLGSKGLPTVRSMQGKYRLAALALIHGDALTSVERRALRLMADDVRVSLTDQTLAHSRLATG